MKQKGCAGRQGKTSLNGQEKEEEEQKINRNTEDKMDGLCEQVPGIVGLVRKMADGRRRRRRIIGDHCGDQDDGEILRRQRSAR